MRSYIDIEGSGEKVTIITSGLGDKVSPPSVATVKGSDLAELRFLTVENTGSGSVSVAILNINASVSLVFVTASVLNGGDAYGVYTFGSTRIKMQNLTATASGTVNCFGVYNSSSVITMSDVTATATSRTGGANSYGIYNSGSVPTMTNVTANAVGTDGGENSYGIYSSSASFTMKNVTASALGAKNNYGIYNHGIYSTTPTMTNVIASAYGGAGKINSYAVYNDSSSLTMTNVTAIASGASNNYGISNNTNGTIKINNSVIKAINTVDNNGTVQTFIGNSQLDGGWGFNNGTGSLTCVGVYGAAYLGLSSACN
jgi:hypothetical protein